jgi:hypothetical protein
MTEPYSVNGWHQGQFCIAGWNIEKTINDHPNSDYF